MKNKRNIMMLLLLISCCLQNVVLIEFNTFGLKLFHVFSLIFLIPILKKQKIILPPKIISIIFVYFFVVTISASIFYGFHSLFLSYIFCYYLLIVILTIGKDMNKNDWDWIFTKCAWIILILVYINALININVIIKFLNNPNGHPVYKFVFGGGANLEATWLGLFGFTLKNDKKGFAYNGLALIISTILASRVGIICNIICFIYMFLFKGKKEKMKLMSKIIVSTVLLSLGMVIMTKTNFFEYILKRFSIIGNDPGSLGRLSMWKYVFEATIYNPFGYGLGNSIKGLSIAAGYTITEGNVHNLLFQMLLDVGIIGAGIYIIILVYFFRLAIKYFFKNGYIAFLSMYFLLGFLQFRGGDAIMFFVLGVFLQLKLYKDKENI